jgi:hypothetical protein
MKGKGVIGATGPRTRRGKERSSQNARKHGLTASRILPSEAELVDALFEEYRKEFRLEGAAEFGIGRKLAYNELRLRQIIDYETYRFEVAEAYAVFQGTDRQFRSHFEAVFLRNGPDAGVVPSRRLPASVAKQYLSNLKTRVESRGPQTDEDVKALAHIYGKEMDMLAGTVILNYCAFDRLGNADPEALQNLTAEILRSIDAAIEVEQMRSQLQSAAESIEFANDAPILAPDTELEQINRYRTQYERQRSRLLNELRIIRGIKRGDDR